MQMENRKCVYRNSKEVLEAVFALPSDVEQSDDDPEGRSDEDYPADRHAADVDIVAETGTQSDTDNERLFQYAVPLGRQ